MVVEFYRCHGDRNRTGGFGFLSSVLIFITAYTVARNGLWASRFSCYRFRFPLRLPDNRTVPQIGRCIPFSCPAFFAVDHIAVPFSFSISYLSMPRDVPGFLFTGSFHSPVGTDGGYLIGMGFGQKRPKLFPSISPKIREGFAGSIVLQGGRLCPLQAGHVAVRMVPLHDTGLYHQRFRVLGI